MAAPALLAAAAVTLAVAIDGGYSPAGRAGFAGLAGFALMAALLQDDRLVLRALRSPPMAALAALAVLCGVSAAWTVAEPADAVRWGLVVAGYAAVALAAALVAREPRGLAAIGWLLVALAAVTAVVGLWAAGARELPFAQRIGGSWRPGGTFEYPPALALLQVAALPAALRAAAATALPPGLAGAAAASLAGATIALSDSRTALGLAVVVVAVAVWAPRPTLRSTRARAALACALPIAAGLAAHLVAGGYSPPRAAAGAGDAAVLLAAALAPALAWPLARRLSAAAPAPGEAAAGPARRLGIAAGGAVVAVLAAGTLAADLGGERGSLRGIEPRGGLAHGRTDTWHAALATARERPVAGHGAEGFLAASAAEQGEAPVRYAHNLPLEAWVELGLAGLLLVLALYTAVARLAWRVRRAAGGWLVAPAALAFLAANLVDWHWHLAGLGGVWAVALGGLVALGADSQDLS